MKIEMAGFLIPDEMICMVVENIALNGFAPSVTWKEKVKIEKISE